LGPVLQLDAIDAVLEAGQTDAVHTRVSAARGLAASGLDEARRAVDALRDRQVAGRRSHVAGRRSHVNAIFAKPPARDRAQAVTRALGSV